MSKVKNISVFLCLVLFLGNYHICDFFYIGDLDAWWSLRTTLYSLVFFLFSLTCFVGSDGWGKIITSQLMLYTLGDLMDRLFFKPFFHSSDYVLMFFSVILFLNQIRKHVQSKNR